MMASKAEKLAIKLFGTKKFKTVNSSSHKLIKRYKIVVFIPVEKTDKMTFAMASAGAGTIGNYSLCSFRTPGTGTFIGNEKSAPAIGAKSRFETAEEIRLEMICDKKNVNAVIDKIYEVHPYDEPAFEVYEVMTRQKAQNNEILTINLKQKLTVKKLLKKINPALLQNNLPGKIKNIRVRKCIVDCSESEITPLLKSNEKAVYIKKNKKNIKAYLI